MNVFAVLYDIAERERCRASSSASPRGSRHRRAARHVWSTYYFAWYLVRAFEHAGNPERYFELLSWRDLLPMNYTAAETYTTWPETRDQRVPTATRWSAHPTPTC